MGEKEKNVYIGWVFLQDSVCAIFSEAIFGAQMGSALTARAAVSALFFLFMREQYTHWRSRPS